MGNKSDLLATFGAMKTLADNASKISKGMGAAKSAYEAIKWLVNDCQDETTRQITALSALVTDGFARTQASIRTIAHETQLDAVDDALAAINGAISDAEAALATYDPATCHLTIDGRWVHVLTWFGGTAGSEDCARNRIYNAVFGRSPTNSMRFFFQPRSSMGGADGTNFDFVVSAWKDVTGHSADVANNYLRLANTTCADLRQYVYGQVAALYLRAVAIHNAGLATAVEVAFQPLPIPATVAVGAQAASGSGANIIISQATADAIALVAQQYKALGARGTALERQAFDALYANDLRNYWSGKSMWTLVNEQFRAIAQDQANFSPQSVYSHEANALQDHAPADLDIKYAQAYSYAQATCPDADGFITGVRLNGIDDVEVQYESTGASQHKYRHEYHTAKIFMQAHFSKIDAKGEIQALGWFPTTAPTCDHQPFFVRCAAMTGVHYTHGAGVDFARLIDPSREMLVMTSIGLAGTGMLGSGEAVGLSAVYAKLRFNDDGTAKVVSLGNDIDPKAVSSYSGRNWLKISGGLSDGRSYSDGRYLKTGPTGRLLLDGTIDPSGIVTNVSLLRREKGSTLFLEAQVNAPFHLLRQWQVWKDPQAASASSTTTARPTRTPA